MSEIRKAALPPKFQELRWVLMCGAPRYIVCGRAPVGLRRSSPACMDPEADLQRAVVRTIDGRSDFDGLHSRKHDH